MKHIFILFITLFIFLSLILNSCAAPNTNENLTPQIPDGRDFHFNSVLDVESNDKQESEEVEQEQVIEDERNAADKIIKNNKKQEHLPIIKPLATDSIPINVEVVTNEILNKYDSFYEFIDPIDERHNYEQKLIFIPIEVINDFKFIGFGQTLENATLDDSLIYIDKILYSIDELSPEKPFITTWLEIGLMPHRGISYMNEDGEKRTLYLTQSGYDGSLVFNDLY